MVRRLKAGEPRARREALVTSLDALSPHHPAAVTTLTLGEREAAWLRAIGLFEGTTVTLLRRAPLGGPLHVRVSGGAELAVDRQLAKHVMVSPEQVSP